MCPHWPISKWRRQSLTPQPLLSTLQESCCRPFPSLQEGRLPEFIFGSLMLPGSVSLCKARQVAGCQAQMTKKLLAVSGDTLTATALLQVQPEYTTWIGGSPSLVLLLLPQVHPLHRQELLNVCGLDAKRHVGTSQAEPSPLPWPCARRSPSRAHLSQAQASTSSLSKSHPPYKTEHRYLFLHKTLPATAPGEHQPCF